MPGGSKHLSTNEQNKTREVRKCWGRDGVKNDAILRPKGVREKTMRYLGKSIPSKETESAKALRQEYLGVFQEAQGGQ